jgi:hypothetical protein
MVSAYRKREMQRDDGIPNLTRQGEKVIKKGEQES